MLRLMWCMVCFVSCHSVQEKVVVNTIYNESSLIQFIQSCAKRKIDDSIRSLDSLLAEISNDSSNFCKTSNYLTRFYSDPNSSLRNEAFYGQLLKAQMKSKWYSAKDKQETVRKFQLLHQNDVGSLANDFGYRMSNGQLRKMYELQANQLLLFFYNPECGACKQMSNDLKSSHTISTAAARGRLKILCVYTDNNLSIWTKHLQEFPSNWVQGRDENEYIYKNGIYDLKAIPTIYLLGRDKKVILKDCTSIEKLEQSLQ